MSDLELNMDLSWEHDMHKELLPSKCYKCSLEEEELTMEKRLEESEQADRAELEELTKHLYDR